MIPILYESTETAFTTNGICRLSDCISCVVTEERNGIYECDFEYPITGAYYDQIWCGRIIAVRHDDSYDVQPFDIVSYSRPIDGVVSFHAVHISYRQLEMVARGTNINSLAGAFSCLESASPSNPFTYETDITSTNYFAAGDGIPRSVRQMLGGVEGSILDSYGGEFEWDKFTVRLWKNRGQQKEFTIRYGLNMVDFQEDSDYLGTYTSAIPYWTGSDDAGGQVTVVGNRVDSGLTSVSGRDICVPVDLTDKFETKPTASQLQSFMANKMIADAVNLPSQSISVNFVRLEDNEVLSELYKCKLCDSVQVVFSRYNIQRWFKIVRTEFDVLKGRYNKMELGALSTSLSEALGISVANDGKPYTVGDLNGINAYLSGNIYLNNGAEIAGHPFAVNNVLWTGGYYMSASHTATLSQNVSAQVSGIVLCWSAYVDGAAQNYDWFYQFIPKWHVSAHGGTGVGITMTTVNFGKVGSKYVYVYNNRIVGNDYNTSTGTASGVTRANNYWVLRAVIGV